MSDENKTTSGGYQRQIKCHRCPTLIPESELTIVVGGNAYHTNCWPGVRQNSEQVFSCATDELFQKSG